MHLNDNMVKRQYITNQFLDSRLGVDAFNISYLSFKLSF